jgi:predicted NUDIX family NTP pyrophosphohydrolase
MQYEKRVRKFVCIAAFPEVDRAAWFDLNTARSKILSGQSELLHRLEKIAP